MLGVCCLRVPSIYYVAVSIAPRPCCNSLMWAGPDNPGICACRSKARQFHPDVNKEPGAEQQFKDVSNAYEVLNDDQKRGIYDK